MKSRNAQQLSNLVDTIRQVKDNFIVTQSQIKEAVNQLNLPKPVKIFLLWLVAWTLRNKNVFSFLKAYLVIGCSYLLTFPSLLETIINFFLGNTCFGNALLSIVHFCSGTIDHVIFIMITIVVLIVVFLHFIVKLQDNKVRKEISNLINELTFNPEKDWFDKKCNIAIKTLGNRCSSDINYRAPRLLPVYTVLVMPDKLVLSLRKSLQSYIKECNQLCGKLPLEYNTKNLNEKIEEIKEIYNRRKIDKFDIIFKDVEMLYDKFYEISMQNRDDFPGFNTDSLTELLYQIQSNEMVYKFISNPILYIKGDAGSGKSHFLADIVNSRMTLHMKTLFALGLEFNEIGDVRERLMNIWCVKGSWDDFLYKLNKIGELEKHRILIIIDGINEGLGNQLWPDVLSGLEADILQYSNLGLVISARTFSGKNMLDGISSNKASITLTGFQGMEDEAITYMTGKFGVTLPRVTRYRREFSNPLFLKLYCQTYSNQNNPIPRSFLDVARNYFDKVNEKLSIKYKYANQLFNYTKQVTDALTELYINQSSKIMVKYSKFDDLLSKVKTLLPKEIVCRYLQDLVSEGVLMSFVDSEGNICVDFNFDLAGDYMYAEALINHGWKDYSERIKGQGIYEATCVLLPLMKNIEIFDYNLIDISPSRKEYYFIQTLKQRFSFSDSAIEKIRRVKTEDIDTFYELLPVLVIHPECRLLIEQLNTELKEMSMVVRDKKWSMHFTDYCSIPSQSELLLFAQWAASISRKSACLIPNQVLYHSACVLIWAFSSPYRLLRDVATKAVINILQDKPDVVISVISFFDDVNDPYIQQRLYAVVHGCVFRGNCGSSVKLGRKVFDLVFDTEAVRLDIMLRDYARCAVDFINQNNQIPDIDISKIEPPYNNPFNFMQCPDRDTVERKYRINETMGYEKDSVWTQNVILSSMETEYSNGVCGYGDFGRYTFEACLSNWENCDGYNPSLLRNFALYIIFEKYKFDARIYRYHDFKLARTRAHRPVMERYGKKFQWIALYEILGLLQDNYKMCSLINTTETLCDGTWEPYVRDIDTTTRTYNYYDDNNYAHRIPRLETLEWTHITSFSMRIKHNDEWLNSKEGMSKDLVEKSISIKDDNREEWIVLYGYNSMSPESQTIQDDSEKGLWEFLQAYIVPRSFRDNVIKFIDKEGTQGRHMPEYLNSIYQLYYKDYYYSASYRAYAKTEGLDAWSDLGGKDTSYQISYLPYTSEGEKTIYRLNKKLFDLLNLKDGDREGEYVDKGGNVIAFDPSVNFNNVGQLLVKKKELLEVLKQNDLVLVWPVLFEKDMDETHIGCQFGGCAWLTEKGKINVNMRLYKSFGTVSNMQRKNRDMLIQDYAKLVWYTISFNKEKKRKVQLKIKSKIYIDKVRNR